MNVDGDRIQRHLAAVQDALAGLDRDMIARLGELLERARLAGHTVFLFGNGGSGSTASHLASDLNKGVSRGRNPAYRAMCLNDNIPLMLAYANDEGYGKVFVGPLQNFLRPGDVVIAISGSGNSENVLRAVEYANRNGATTVGLCGFDGGRLKPLVHLAVHVPVDDMLVAEDVHFVVGHVLYRLLAHREGED